MILLFECNIIIIESLSIIDWVENQKSDFEHSNLAKRQVITLEHVL